MDEDTKPAPPAGAPTDASSVISSCHLCSDCGHVADDPDCGLRMDDAPLGAPTGDGRDEVPTEVHERGWQWRPVGDSAFAPPFGTVRACLTCGCLVAGGPTRCGRCANDAATALPLAPSAPPMVPDADSVHVVLARIGETPDHRLVEVERDGKSIRCEWVDRPDGMTAIVIPTGYTTTQLDAARAEATRLAQHAIKADRYIAELQSKLAEARAAAFREAEADAWAVVAEQDRCGSGVVAHYFRAQAARFREKAEAT